MNDKNNFIQRHDSPLFYPQDPSVGFQGGSGGLSRRKFLKRTGGATAAAFLSWNAASVGVATAVEDVSDEEDKPKWILVCTSDPWSGAMKSIDDSWHGGELEVELTQTTGPTKGDIGSGNIKSGGACSEDHNIVGAGSFASIAEVTQSVTMDGDENGVERPIVMFTPPKLDKIAKGTQFNFDANGAPNGEAEPDLGLRLILEDGGLLVAGTWDGNALTVAVTKDALEFTFELDGSMEAFVSYIWTFQVMSQKQYDEWLALNPPPVE